MNATASSSPTPLSREERLRRVAIVCCHFLRNLAGDHPVGMALDDTGARLFVVSDQSHTLATYDTAGGLLTGHTTAYGEAIPLVQNDPLEIAAAISSMRCVACASALTSAIFKVDS